MSNVSSHIVKSHHASWPERKKNPFEKNFLWCVWWPSLIWNSLRLRDDTTSKMPPKYLAWNGRVSVSIFFQFPNYLSLSVSSPFIITTERYNKNVIYMIRMITDSHSLLALACSSAGSYTQRIWSSIPPARGHAIHRCYIALYDTLTINLIEMGNITRLFLLQTERWHLFLFILIEEENKST